MPRSSSRSYMSFGSIAVAHVLARRRPERFHADALLRPLGHRHLERARHARAREVERLGRRVAADALELLAHDGAVLDPVAVGVDHRVGEAIAELPGFGLT